MQRPGATVDKTGSHPQDDAQGEALRAPRYTDAPERIRGLPVDHRGFPVPFFAAWIDGKPDHRVVDRARLGPAVLKDLCWICGEPLAGDRAYVMGPTSAFNRVTTEPASHWDCGCFAASACPFLTRPRMRRSHKGLEAAEVTPPGGMAEHNPGVCVVWATPAFRPTLHRDGKTRLYEIGDPTRVAWFREGRPATRAEVIEALDEVIDTYRPRVAAAGPAAAEQLARYTDRVLALAPAPP
ncbi:MAG: hypothetical protein JNK30_11645 [Phenylobacterium sp.]|uniref:hypothetical protein n=1 Tax=Phenylobacterium sp. TaxID=1871053 RepID=UPI001A634BE8|nr:hypothetical protein [Phenylobacterium sp.]MBL8772024.1 hypothetical protein [Phenylobacterium sp.]